MYLSQLFPDSSEILMRSQGKSPLYVFHQLLWELFPTQPDAKRDFLFRLDSIKGRYRVLLLSSREPTSASWCQSFECKPFTPHLDINQGIGLKVRINPVVRGKNDRDRHDVVMHHKKLHPDTKETPQQIIHTAVYNWLQIRLERNGAVIDPRGFRVDSYGQERISDGRREIKFSTADVLASVVVKDPSKFMALVQNGVGASKSLGCGLVLLRPRRS